MKKVFRWFAVLGCAVGMNAVARTHVPEVVCRVESDRGVLPANRADRAIIKVTLGAPNRPEVSRRPPVNLCLVLDHSGSMSGSKIEQAKEAAIAALRRLNRDDIFSVVIYDHEVETLVPAQHAENMEWIESRIRSIGPRGNTALFAGMSQGAAEIRKNLDGYVSRMILLSDGLANVGPSAPADLGRLGASLRKEKISVTTIGIGTDYNEDLMTQLAQESDGNTYFVESSVDLPRIFAAELGDVLSIVAREVNIRIDCSADVRPLRIIGRDGRIHDQCVELSLNQLYGGQEKYVLLEVEIPATAAGKERELVVARCDYENLLTQKQASSSGRVRVTFSPEEKEVQQSVNTVVNKDIGLNAAAEARKEAVRQMDENKPQDAAHTLRGQAASLRRDAERLNQPDLQEEADRLEKAAVQVEGGAAPAASRKELKSDSFQIINQQENK